MSATEPLSPKKPLSPQLRTSSLALEKRTLQAQLDNWTLCLKEAMKRKVRASEQLDHIDDNKATLQVELSDAEGTIVNATEYITELEKQIKKIQIPADMIEDPHTGLLCTIRHVCGEYALDDVLYVGVQLDDTDNSTRWIPLSDIEKHSVAGPMYASWKTLQTQYQLEIPGGLDLSTEAEFTKAIVTGWQPRVPSINLLPVYQMHDGAPKCPFVDIVNKIERGEDLFCVVCDTSNKRVELPLRAILKFPLTKKLWSRWITLRDICEFDLGMEFHQDKYYTYETMEEMRTKHLENIQLDTLHESPLRTPHSLEFFTPPQKRQRVD